MKNVFSVLLTLSVFLSSPAWAWHHKDRPATPPSSSQTAVADPSAPDDKTVLGPVFDQAPK